MPFHYRHPCQLHVPDAAAGVDVAAGLDAASGVLEGVGVFSATVYFPESSATISNTGFEMNLDAMFL